MPEFLGSVVLCRFLFYNIVLLVGTWEQEQEALVIFADKTRGVNDAT
jgi:hypothetical protein